MGSQDGTVCNGISDICWLLAAALYTAEISMVVAVVVYVLPSDVNRRAL
jgi:hypothetical protein